MITSEQKAQTFLSLHINGELLILPNVWNPIGARVLEHQGYPAVATASASIAGSLGYEKRSTIKDVDFVAGVSIQTVSRVIKTGRMYDMLLMSEYYVLSLS